MSVLLIFLFQLLDRSVSTFQQYTCLKILKEKPWVYSLFLGLLYDSSLFIICRLDFLAKLQLLNTERSLCKVVTRLTMESLNKRTNTMHNYNVPRNRGITVLYLEVTTLDYLHWTRSLQGDVILTRYPWTKDKYNAQLQDTNRDNKVLNLSWSQYIELFCTRPGEDSKYFLVKLLADPMVHTPHITVFADQKHTTK